MATIGSFPIRAAACVVCLRKVGCLGIMVLDGRVTKKLLPVVFATTDSIQLFAQQNKTQTTLGADRY